MLKGLRGVCNAECGTTDIEHGTHKQQRVYPRRNKSLGYEVFWHHVNYGLSIKVDLLILGVIMNQKAPAIRRAHQWGLICSRTFPGLKPVSKTFDSAIIIPRYITAQGDTGGMFLVTSLMRPRQ